VDGIQLRGEVTGIVNSFHNKLMNQQKAPWGTREGKQPARRLAVKVAAKPLRVPGAFLEWAAKPTFSFDDVYLPLVGSFPLHAMVCNVSISVDVHGVVTCRT
jgi:hypothetical protein